MSAIDHRAPLSAITTSIEVTIKVVAEIDQHRSADLLLPPRSTAD